jgi:hypothetical protein
MIDFIELKGLKPHIDAVFPLSEIHAALDRLESGRQFGKTGLSIAPARSPRLRGEGWGEGHGDWPPG